MDRRHFGAWLCALFGIKATETTAMAASTPSPTKKGLMCIYINVGQLPVYKAEVYVDRFKDQFRKTGMMNDWEVMWVPVRPPQETRIEFFNLDGKPISANQCVKVKEILKGEPFVAPDRKKTTDAILMYLGAPVCQIELDQQQLDLVYDETKALFDKSANVGCLSDEIFKNIALAKATIMLGMVRNKWKTEDKLTLNGADLIKSGTEDLAQWLAYLDNV